MKKRLVRIVTFLSVTLTLSSCFKQSDVQLKSKLLGTWELDSVSSPSGNYGKERGETRTLTFVNKTDYSYEWWTGDVGNTFKGKYFILNNPQRGLKTISFIPDIEVESTRDTVRTAYMNFDIVSLNLTRLQVVDETEFVPRRDYNTRSIRFSKNYIYKRSEVR
jgi:hypothetical protein